MIGPLFEGQHNLLVVTYTQYSALTKKRVLWADRLFTRKYIFTILQECLQLCSRRPRTLQTSKCKNMTIKLSKLHMSPHLVLVIPEQAKTVHLQKAVQCYKGNITQKTAFTSLLPPHTVKVMPLLQNWKPGFYYGLVHVVDKVALGQVCLQYFNFFPLVASFHPGLANMQPLVT